MTKFITIPKKITTPNGLFYFVEALGATVLENEVSNSERFSICFHFFRNIEGEFVEVENYTTTIKKVVNIPDVGPIDFYSGLVNSDKQIKYNVARLFAINSGYTLLPIEEQTDLNS